MEYKHSILLQKFINIQNPSMEWIELNFNQTLTSRETFFNLIKSVVYTSVYILLNQTKQKLETTYCQHG